MTVHTSDFDKERLPLAPVISLDAARERFAPNCAARKARQAETRAASEEAAARELAARAAAERERWIADLATWPPPFQRALHQHVEIRTSLDRLRDVADGFNISAGPEWVDTCRGCAGAADVPTIGHSSGHAYYRSLRSALGELQAAATRLRAAQTQRRLVAQRRTELGHAKRGVLKVLWLFGRRRILRQELEPPVLDELARESKRIPERIESERRQIAEIRERLRRGQYKLGPKAGRRLSAEVRAQLERKVEQLEEESAREKLRLAALAAEPDPLRAWGLYARRAQP
jgi:hypothetical protein